MNRRSLLDVALVGLVSTVVGGFTYAQVIVTGVFPKTKCTFITNCVGATTICPTPGAACSWCTSPQTQKRCLNDAKTDCTETTWGPNNGCGAEFTGTCPNPPFWPAPCAGPFLNTGWCPMLMCFDR